MLGKRSIILSDELLNGSLPQLMQESNYTNYIQCFRQVDVLDSSGQSIGWSYLTPTGQADSGRIGVIGYPTKTMYSTHIRYVAGAGWAYYFDQIHLLTITGDSSIALRSGAQSSVMVASNSFTSSDFNGFITKIGGSYTSGGVTYPLCATSYLYNGNWHAAYPGEYAPAGYVYEGGNFINSLSTGTQGPPTTWGSNNIGIYSGMKERFAVGTIAAGGGYITQGSHGSLLWSYGQVY